MTFHVARWDAPSSGPMTRHGAAPAAGAVGLSSQEFKEGKLALRWTDMPEATQKLDNNTGEFVFEFVLDFQHLARKINGAPHQVRAGTRVYTDRLIVGYAVRPLSKGADGKMRPSGSWRHLDGSAHTPTTAPTRTQGVVPAAVCDAMPARATPSALPKEHASGATALAYLPPVVQATITRATPEPTAWFGGATQVADGQDAPVSQWVHVLRMNDTHAVAVVAARHAGSRPAGMSVEQADAAFQKQAWTVTQMTFDFSERPTLISGAHK